MSAYVNSTSVFFSAGTGGPYSLTLNGVGTGNLLVIGCSFFNSSTVTISDGHNTYIEVLPSISGANSLYDLHTLYCLNVTGGNLTFTVTAAGSNFAFVTVAEYSGISSFDVYANNTAATAGNVSASATLANAGELLVAFPFSIGQSTLTIGSGWAQRQYAASTGYAMLADQLTGPSAGVQTLIPATESGANGWSVSVVAFVASAPPPPPVVSGASFPLPVYKATGIF